MLSCSLFFVHLGKARGKGGEAGLRENCARRNTFLNIAGQLQRRDGWKLLVIQLRERMGRREKDTLSKRDIPLREFQKYDSTFSTYLTGKQMHDEVIRVTSTVY